MKLESSIGNTLNSQLDKALEDTMSNIEKKQTQEDKADKLADSLLDDMFEPEVITSDEKVTQTEKPKRFGELLPEDRNLAVSMSLVPARYKNAAFDVDKIKDNIKNDWIRSKELYLTYNFEEYISLCASILNCIRLGQLPQRSYIIGAPNSFGKTSFVTECIMTLNKNCYRVAPYISLYELGEIRKIDSDIIMKPYSYRKYYKYVAKDSTNPEKTKEYLSTYTKNNVLGNHIIEPRKNLGTKTPDTVYGQYSYSEYINSACAFVSLSGIASKDVESHELNQLLNIRGMKGLPTIVMMHTSLDPYTNDEELRENVWDDILSYRETDDLFDRLFHVSTYKVKSLSRIDSEDVYRDKETGIVYKHRGN